MIYHQQIFAHHLETASLSASCATIESKEQDMYQRYLAFIKQKGQKRRYRSIAAELAHKTFDNHEEES